MSSKNFRKIIKQFIKENYGSSEIGTYKDAFYKKEDTFIPYAELIIAIVSDFGKYSQVYKDLISAYIGKLDIEGDNFIGDIDVEEIKKTLKKHNVYDEYKALLNLN